MKRFLAVILCLMILMPAAVADTGNVYSMSFSDAVSIDRIKALDGQTVTIIGYMATLSPISGKYIYLMNMPYQSCPFCVPNTAQLANTMAVYARDGQKFTFTDAAVRITGELRVEDYEDEFGYTYNYRIVNAVSTEVDMSDISPEYRLWQTIAAEGIVSDLNDMFDYVHFLCQWPYYQVSYLDDDGNEVVYNLYDGDVWMYLEDDGIYGYADKANDEYFPSLYKRIRKLSSNLEDLVAIVSLAEKAAQRGMDALENGDFVYDSESDSFILNNDDALYNAWYEAYLAYAEWMARWQL